MYTMVSDSSIKYEAGLITTVFIFASSKKTTYLSSHVTQSVLVRRQHPRIIGYHTYTQIDKKTIPNTLSAHRLRSKSYNIFGFSRQNTHIQCQSNEFLIILNGTTHTVSIYFNQKVLLHFDSRLNMRVPNLLNSNSS